MNQNLKIKPKNFKFQGILFIECRPYDNSTVFATTIRTQNQTAKQNVAKSQPLSIPGPTTESAIEADLMFRISNKKWLDFMIRQTKQTNKTQSSKSSKKLTNGSIINRIIGNKPTKEIMHSNEINIEILNSNEKKISPFDYSMEYVELNSKLISISSLSNNGSSSETNNKMNVKTGSLSIQTIPQSATGDPEIASTTIANELVALNATLTTISIPYQGLFNKIFFFVWLNPVNYLSFKEPPNACFMVNVSSSLLHHFLKRLRIRI